MTLIQFLCEDWLEHFASIDWPSSVLQGALTDISLANTCKEIFSLVLSTQLILTLADTFIADASVLVTLESTSLQMHYLILH